MDNNLSGETSRRKGVRPRKGEGMSKGMNRQNVLRSTRMWLIVFARGVVGAKTRKVV